jgi:hypothetical protein
MEAKMALKVELERAIEEIREKEADVTKLSVKQFSITGQLNDKAYHLSNMIAAQKEVATALTDCQAKALMNAAWIYWLEMGGKSKSDKAVRLYLGKSYLLASAQANKMGALPPNAKVPFWTVPPRMVLKPFALWLNPNAVPVL